MLTIVTRRLRVLITLTAACLGLTLTSPAWADVYNGVDDTTTATNACAQTSTATSVSAIFVIHLENISRAEALNASNADSSHAFATYLNQCGDGQKAVGLTHSSTANYVGLLDGNALSDACLPQSRGPANCGPFTYNNLDAQMGAAGNGGPYRAYLQSMPSNCALSDSGQYVAHHNALLYLRANANTNCATDDVPYSQLAGDVQNDNAAGHPSFYDIIPDQLHNAHSGWTNSVDTFLSSTVSMIVNSPLYQAHHAAVVITADEGDVSLSTVANPTGQDCVSSPDAGCNIPFVVIAPNENGRNVTTQVSAYSILRSMESAISAPYLGRASAANGLFTLFALADGIS